MKANWDTNSNPSRLAFCQKENNQHNVHTTLFNSGCWQRICEVAAVHAGGSSPF